MTAELSPKEANKRTTNLITDMIELTGLLRVKPDNKVAWENNLDQDIIFNVGSGKSTSKKILYVYTPDCKDPNAVLLNPLSEPTLITKELIWFYDTLSSLYSVTFRNVLAKIVDVTVKAKTDKNVITSPMLIELLSPLVEHIDDKMLNEVELFIECEKKKDIIHFAYKKSDKTYGLYSLFQDESNAIKNSFKKGAIRKKFWDFLEKAFQEIFSKESAANPSEPIIMHSATSGDITCPRFKTFTQTYKVAWERLYPFLCLLWSEDRCDSVMERINSIDGNIEYIDQLAKKTMWAASSNVADIEDIKKEKNTTAPGSHTSTYSAILENNNPTVNVPYPEEMRKPSALEVMESKHGDPWYRNRTTSNYIDARNDVYRGNRFSQQARPHMSTLDVIDHVMNRNHSGHQYGYNNNNNNYGYGYGYYNSVRVPW